MWFWRKDCTLVLHHYLFLVIILLWVTSDATSFACVINKSLPSSSTIFTHFVSATCFRPTTLGSICTQPHELTTHFFTRYGNDMRKEYSVYLNQATNSDRSQAQADPSASRAFVAAHKLLLWGGPPALFSHRYRHAMHWPGARACLPR